MQLQGEAGLADTLRERGVRATAQRAVILRTLCNVGGHVSAQDVYERALPDLPGLNLATVYRTLELFHHVGLVDVLNTGTDVQKFTFRDPHHQHAHLVCRRCGKTLQVDATSVDRLAGDIERATGFRIDHHHLALTGVCQDCLVDEVNPAG